MHLPEKIVKRRNQYQEEQDKAVLLELNSVKKQLQSEISFFDFCHVCTFSLNINNKKLNRAKSIQNKKLSNLVLENSNFVSGMSHDPGKMIFNFFSHDLSDDKKSLFCIGLNFLIPPKRLDYSDHMLPLELLLNDINKNDIPNEDKEFMKSRLEDSAFSSFRSYN